METQVSTLTPNTDTELTNIQAFYANGKAYLASDLDRASARNYFQISAWNILSDGKLQDIEEMKGTVKKGAIFEKLKATLSEVNLCHDNRDNAIVIDGMDKGLDFGTIAKAFRKARTEAAKPDDVKKQALEALDVTPAQLAKMPQAVQDYTIALGMEKLKADKQGEIKARVIADLATLRDYYPESFAEVLADFTVIHNNVHKASNAA